MRRVIAVDDDTDLCRLIQLASRKLEGAELRVYSNPWEGLAQAVHEPPDLLILDVVMPDLSGPQLLKEYRRKVGASRTKVAFLTANTQPDEVQALLDLGACQVWAKPFTPGRLLGDIATLLDQQES